MRYITKNRRWVVSAAGKEDYERESKKRKKSRQYEFVVGDFEWAFVLLGEMTMDALEELKVLTNCAFENFRKDGEKND